MANVIICDKCNQFCFKPDESITLRAYVPYRYSKQNITLGHLCIKCYEELCEELNRGSNEANEK